MEDSILDTINDSETPKRSQFLTTLCILSFIYSGFMLLVLVLILCFSGAMFDVLQSIIANPENYPTVNQSQLDALQKIIDIGASKFAMIIAFAIIIIMTSLLGVVKMWKSQKWGFYIYATINSLLLIYNIVDGSYFSAVISLAFIGMYFMNLKQMR